MNLPAPDSCQSDSDPNSLDVDTARARIIQCCPPLRAMEKVNVRAALDRVLAEPIVAPLDVPAHDNSAMDGFAARGAELTDGATLSIVGSSLAGHPHDRVLAAGETIRITTGAVMPAGADTVVIQENTQRDDASLTVLKAPREGENVRAAGEDLKAGEHVLAPGRRLTPADLGLVASLGLTEVAVMRRLRVAFFSTGDELKSLGQPLCPGDIYDSNRYTLLGMLARAGCDAIDLGVVRDEEIALKDAMQAASANADVVITSGGVSVGDADYVKQVFGEVGQVHFWKVAMKPGRPLAFGEANGARFFGLPGNPVSVMVTFYQFVLPALKNMMGEMDWQPLQVQAVCKDRLRKRPGRTEFQRARLALGMDGALEVHKTGAQGSGILRSMSDANCFVILPNEASAIEPGMTVTVQPFAGLV